MRGLNPRGSLTCWDRRLHRSPPLEPGSATGYENSSVPLHLTGFHYRCG